VTRVTTAVTRSRSLHALPETALESVTEAVTGVTKGVCRARAPFRGGPAVTVTRNVTAVGT
jgi:hypothetical protein